MHFYGMSFRDVVDMPLNWFFKIYDRIRTVESRRAFRQIDIESYPHTDERCRENIIQRLMNDSGYARSKAEHEQADNQSNNFEAGWNILRGIGKKNA